MRRLTVGQNDAGQRLDKFLKKITVGLPDSLLYKYLRKKCVKVNGRHVTDGAYFLSQADELTLYMSEEFFRPVEEAFLGLEPALCVAYEDENVLVVEKAAGQSCHADDLQRTGTLIDHVKAYLYRKGEYDPSAEQSFAPALANRIDRNTAGLVLCAKNAPALRALSQMIKERRIEKEYRALVYGTPEPSCALLTHYLCKDEKTRRVQVYDTPRAGALTASTEYRVLRTDGQTSLLAVRLHTGRTHQIRAVFAHLGHPLVGDGKYAPLAGRDTLGFSHQALLSYRVLFCPAEQDAPLCYLAGREVTVTALPAAFLE